MSSSTCRNQGPAMPGHHDHFRRLQWLAQLHRALEYLPLLAVLQHEDGAGFPRRPLTRLWMGLSSKTGVVAIRVVIRTPLRGRRWTPFRATTSPAPQAGPGTTCPGPLRAFPWSERCWTSACGLRRGEPPWRRLGRRRARGADGSTRAGSSIRQVEAARLQFRETSPLCSVTDRRA